VERVRSLAESVGSWALALSPEEHDRAVAASSHMPHLAAVALVQALQQTSRSVPAALQLLAGGFRDTTRVASGSPEMWRDICLTNRESILETLRELKLSLDELEEAVGRRDGEQLVSLLSRAKAFRDGLLKRSPDS
jgi:prephenate dehydrogenase